MRKVFRFLYPVIILAAICLVVSLALSSTNMITKNKIEKINNENREKAMARVLKAESYEEKTFDANGKEITYYVASDSGNITGYIFITGANGYGGKVEVMTAVLPDKTVKAVEILDVSGETPGLGQNAAKEDFYGQYSGKSGKLTVVKSNPDSNEIKAVTGATITSTGVTSAVNEALSYSNAIIKTQEGENVEK